MDENDRKIILDNIDILIAYTDYKKLMVNCRRMGLLNEAMVEMIENTKENEETKHRRLLEKITRRGPTAFRILQDICQNNFLGAYKILNPATNSGECHSIREEKLRMCEQNQNKEPSASQTTNLSNIVLNNNIGPENLINNVAESIDTKDNGAANEIILRPFTKEIKNKININVIKSKKFHEHPKISTYPMKTRNRGVFFLVNIIHFRDPILNRNGAEVDRDNLIKLFRDFGFTVFYYEDLTHNQLERLLNEFIVSQYLRHTDSLVFGMLTHGDNNGSKNFIEFSDGSHTDVENILKKFSNVECELLINKPKIFLFPFCRGSIPDKGKYKRLAIKTKIESDSISRSVTLPVNLPTFSDILICYATVPGYQTHRDPDEGSWYIQELCKVFAEHAHDSQIDDLLKMIGARTGEYRTHDGDLQTPGNEHRGFNKILFFNPGYYESTD